MGDFPTDDTAADARTGRRSRGLLETDDTGESPRPMRAAAPVDDEEDLSAENPPATTEPPAPTEREDAPDDALYRRPIAPPEGRIRIAAQDQTRVRRSNPTPSAAPAAPPSESDHRYSVGDLIDQLSPPAPLKASRGWRARLGLKPSQREADELRDVQLTKSVFDRPVTIMVANPKGGSGKTPISVLLAAAFGHHRGGGVVAWDNNELRGTLPDRTHSPHRRTIHDLVDALDRRQWKTTQFTDLAYFLNHQESGLFHTLGSAQRAGHVVTGEHFSQVHEVFARYFQIIVIDTGNNEGAPNWNAAAMAADCLVVPTKWRKDSLIPAARMLESMQDTNPGLLDRTVIAATNGPMDSQKDVKDNGASWFGTNHPIVEIPTDPHIAEGGVIDFDHLREPTRRAALRLAAEVSTRLIAAGRTA